MFHRLMNNPVFYIFYFIDNMLTDAQETPDGIWNLKTACLHSGASILTISMHNHVWCNRSHNADFHAIPNDSVSRQTHFFLCRHHLVHPLAWSCSTSLLPLELWQKQGLWHSSCQIGDLKQWIQKCIQGICKEMLQCHMTSFPLWLWQCI